MVVRLSALPPAALYPPGRFRVLISVGGCVDPRAIVRLEGLGQLKNLNGLIGNLTRLLPACSIVTRPIQLHNIRLKHLWVYVTHQQATSRRKPRVFCDVSDVAISIPIPCWKWESSNSIITITSFQAKSRVGQKLPTFQGPSVSLSSDIWPTDKAASPRTFYQRVALKAEVLMMT
jgi:hypothetical protein